MTDKKQIIIDGVDVSKCKFAITNKKEGIYSGTKCLISNRGKPYNICECNSNCYFKQLARKTQECDRYCKALEEIEGIVKNFGSYAAWQEQRINKILDIINKAKGE